MNKYKIYKLVYDNKVYYVGRTKRDLRIRKAIGLYKRPEVNNMYKISDIVLIEETCDKKRESYWIKHFINIGEPIMNIYKNDYDESSSKKEYYKKNKNIILEKRREKRMTEEYKAYINEYSRIYRCNNGTENNKKNILKYYKNKLNNYVSNE